MGLKSQLQLKFAQSLSCVFLFVTPWTVVHQAPLSMGFFRQEYWSRLLFTPPGDLPKPGIEPVSCFSLHWQADSLLLSHLGSPVYPKARGNILQTPCVLLMFLRAREKLLNFLISHYFTLSSLVNKCLVFWWALILGSVCVVTVWGDVFSHCFCSCILHSLPTLGLSDLKVHISGER